MRRFACVDRAAEATPVPGIKDARYVIAKLQQITTILDDDDRSRGVLGVKRALVAQEVAKSHSVHSGRTY